MSRTIRRLEEDGTYIMDKDHFEFFETHIYIYQLHSKYYKCGYSRRIQIPADIVRHLGLKHKDNIMVAIKKKE